MAKITDIYSASEGKVVVMCDFSPPRGVDSAPFIRIGNVGADVVSVAYSPGKSVRADSVATAHTISQHNHQQVVFSLAPRDMNKLALQSHLLGGQLLNLENVIVLSGDNLSDSELSRVKDVRDYTVTELIRSIELLNQGQDYKGLKLAQSTDFCVGATIDLSKEIKDFDDESRLAFRKHSAGAEFFVTQTFFGVETAIQFQATYQQAFSQALPPVFYGVPIMVPGGLTFGRIPPNMAIDLDNGRSGTDIAIEAIDGLMAHGMNGIYLVPPILKGGRRDYKAAAEVIRRLRNR